MAITEKMKKLNMDVATDVMGWMPHYLDDDDKFMWVIRNEGLLDFQWTGYISEYMSGFLGPLNFKLADGRMATTYSSGDIWNPARDMNMAWTVVECVKKKLRPYTCKILLHTNIDLYQCDITSPTIKHGKLSVIDESPELAICEAVLKLVKLNHYRKVFAPLEEV